MVNYDLYQTDDKPKDSQPPSNLHSNDNLTTTIEEYKEEKEGNKKHNVQTALALFEQLWKLYPCKKGKGQVSERQKLKLLDIGYDEAEQLIGMRLS